MILTLILQIQLTKKLNRMMQKMCKMTHIVVQVVKMTPNKSMKIQKKMIMISRKHQHQIVHR
jgi:hypothetical protein